jgi:hypothetical protein
VNSVVKKSRGKSWESKEGNNWEWVIESELKASREKLTLTSRFVICVHQTKQILLFICLAFLLWSHVANGGKIFRTKMFQWLNSKK